MIIVRLVLKSLLNRRLTALLTCLSIALSVGLFLAVDMIRLGARESFASTISDTDLIVGARGGSIELLLYSVFRIGNVTKDFSWKTYQEIAARPEISWIVPISLGDAHHGFRVLGTTTAYFDRYRYRGGQGLRFVTGGLGNDLFDTVIGADVATDLHYGIDQKIIISHGIGEVSFHAHADKPFRVTGILRRTGTPVDRTVYVSLEAIEAIHVDWSSGSAPSPGQGIDAGAARLMQLSPQSATAAYIGVKSRINSLALQRWIGDFPTEPMTAILPGIALQEIWSILSVSEQAMLFITALIIAIAFLGMITMILAGLNVRRRELAILRAVGAQPYEIAELLVLEAFILTLGGAMLGLLLAYGGLAGAGPAIDSLIGIHIDFSWPGREEIGELAAIVMVGTLAGLFPAARAYHFSLADNLIVRL